MYCLILFRLNTHTHTQSECDWHHLNVIEKFLFVIKIKMNIYIYIWPNVRRERKQKRALNSELERDRKSIYSNLISVNAFHIWDFWAFMSYYLLLNSNKWNRLEYLCLFDRISNLKLHLLSIAEMQAEKRGELYQKQTFFVYFRSLSLFHFYSYACVFSLTQRLVITRVIF